LEKRDKGILISGRREGGKKRKIGPLLSLSRFEVVKRGGNFGKKGE